MRHFAIHWLSFTCRLFITTLLLSTAAQAGDITAFVDDGRLLIIGSDYPDDVIVSVRPDGVTVNSRPYQLTCVNGEPEFSTTEPVNKIMVLLRNGSDRFQLNLTADLPGGLSLDDAAGDDDEVVMIPAMNWLDEGVPVSIGPIDIATGSGDDWVRLNNPDVEYTGSVNVKCNSGNDRIDLYGTVAGEVLMDSGGGFDDVLLYGQYEGPVALSHAGPDFDVFPMNIVSAHPIHITSASSADIVISVPWENPSPIVGSDGNDRLIFTNVNQVEPIVFESGGGEDFVTFRSSIVEELTLKSDIAMYMRAYAPGEYDTEAPSRLNTLNAEATGLFTTTNMDVGDFNLETVTSENPLVLQHIEERGWVTVDLKDSEFGTMNLVAAQDHDRIEMWDCQVTADVLMSLSHESPRLLMANSLFFGSVRLDSEQAQFATIQFGGCNFAGDVEIIGSNTINSIRNFPAGTHPMEDSEPVTFGHTIMAGDFIMELPASNNVELYSLIATRVFIDLWSGSNEFLITDSQFDSLDLNCRNALCNMTLEEVIADSVAIDFGNSNDYLNLNSNDLGATDFRGNGGSDRIRSDGNNSFDDLVFDGFESVDVPEDVGPAGGFAPNDLTIPFLHNPALQTGTSSNSGSNFSISATTSSSSNTTISASQLSTSSVTRLRVSPSRSTSAPVHQSAFGRMRLTN